MNLFYAAMFPTSLFPSKPPVRSGEKMAERFCTSQHTERSKLGTSWLSYHGTGLRIIEVTEVSVMNSLHSYSMKKYPGDFTDVKDYIYTLCTFATLQHRILVMVGLPGISEKEKIAAHLFWEKISIPSSWDTMTSFMENMENTRIGATQQASLIAEAFLINSHSVISHQASDGLDERLK
ncbi:hypothetical protein N7509_004400 [Penicillium cosmopolitanum]|uniref:ER-bound oxygenase mpaB/mpaB'/Rubber oxygenase catalytic domain-containing protein n=1 Tax=Penicillium cosmopolitanum TaxID=1131564 RepID=A0A9W9W6T5_9EURO|nr:uncharacterized protein N7509_004400 [Penicillium cosmopolitanum]KAJ5404529.1 hypothetical protein N7509_004400 [Penicillium cosmopolitanum]